MNEKIQAILLKLVVELKNLRWSVSPDWEVTLKSEGHVPLAKRISVQGNLDGDEWTDNVEATIDLKLSSDDEVTYFPQYTIYANIYLEGARSKDIAYNSDASIAFTEKDFQDDKKIKSAANQITRLIDDYIKNEYSDYVDQNGQDIQDYKEGGWQDNYEVD